MSVMRDILGPDPFQWVYWHWLAIGVALIGIEILAPGIWLLWIGIGAIGAGLALLAFPDMSWQGQLLVFAALSVAAVMTGRQWWRRQTDWTEEPALNKKSDRLRGKILVLDEPIVAGRGRARVGGVIWNIGGPDLAVGTRVVITAIDGATLMVAPEGDKARTGS